MLSIYLQKLFNEFIYTDNFVEMHKKGINTLSPAHDLDHEKHSTQWFKKKSSITIFVWLVLVASIIYQLVTYIKMMIMIFQVKKEREREIIKSWEMSCGIRFSSNNVAVKIVSKLKNLIWEVHIVFSLSFPLNFCY